MTAVAMSSDTMTAVTGIGQFILGTLTNHAQLILTISAVLLVFGFLARKLSLR